MQPTRIETPISVTLPRFGIALIESHHAHGFRPATFRHAFSKLLLVIDGAGTLRAGHRELALSRHVLVHVPPRVRHDVADVPGDPLSLYGVCYDAGRAGVFGDSLLSKREILRWHLPDVAPHLPGAFRADFREMLFEQWAQQEGWETALRARLGDLIVRAARMEIRFRGRRSIGSRSDHARGRDGAGRVAAYLTRLESGRFLRDTLDDAARATALSRRRFTDLFRVATKSSWLQRVQQMRIDHARRLLRETGKSIASVAFESGFDDASHFHRVFKSIVGHPPSHERRSR
jgi:AraC-like DNA-binding protein